MKCLSHNEVLSLTGLSHVTIWRMEKAGKFPPRFKLGAQKVMWDAAEVEQWLQSRKAAARG